MELRTLRPQEREAFLDLLDGWELADRWRGRDFFARYVEGDPSYRDENVHVAVRDGRIVSCVQLFPRRLRIGGREVPCGGIGSVFTRAGFREQGLAAALLERAVAAMRTRGDELSLLFASRIPWYERLGWRSLERRRALLERPRQAGGGVGLELRAFEPTRDLAAVRDLHARFSAPRQGSVVRDEALWKGSLRVAGNPGEEFVLARRGGRLVAYARACVLYGLFAALEWAHEPGHAPDLAELLAALQSPRDPDPLVERAGARPDARAQLLVGDLALEPELRAAVAARGFRERVLPDRETLLRCLAPERLARRLGVAAPAASADPQAWLAALIAPGGFRFWLADRF